MLFCKVPCESVLFRLALLHLLASPFSFTHFLYIFPVSRLGGNVLLSRSHCYLWSIAIQSAGGFMYRPVPSANLIHYFIHSGHYFGVTGQKWLRQTPFFFITEIWHFSVYERGSESASLWFIPCYQWLLDSCCSFDVIFQCQHSVLSMNRSDIQIVHHQCQQCKFIRTLIILSVR